MAVTEGDNHVEGKGSENQERGKNQTGKQGLENLSSGSEKGGSSWVEVAQENKVLKKYDLKIIDKEGEKAVEVLDDVIDNVNLLREDYLIGKFLDTAHTLLEFMLL